MKVLLISPFGRQLKGGIAAWTGHIMSYYEQHPVDNFELKLLYNPNSKATFANTNFFRRIYNGICSYFPLYRSFVKTIKQEDFDVVHVCTSASISLIKDLAIIRLAHKRHIKTVVHCHFGRIPDIFSGDNWEKRLFKRLLNVTDRLVVMDQKSYDCIVQYGYPNVKNVPNPLAESVQQTILENPTIPRVANKIVFVGHVVRTKGVFELVEACSQLKDIELFVIGPIPDKDIERQLVEMGEKSSNNWLHLSGSMSIEQVIKEMLSCSVFALPTYTEGFPYVIVESMACGCAIATTPVGAIPEILDIASNEPCGLCCEPKDVEGLRRNIQYFLDHPVEAREYGNRAAKRVNEVYAMQRVWEEVVEIWRGIAK